MLPQKEGSVLKLGVSDNCSPVHLRGCRQWESTRSNSALPLRAANSCMCLGIVRSTDSLAGRMEPPEADERGVRLISAGLSDVSIVHPFVREGEWETRFDPRSGWAVMSEPEAHIECAAIFAGGCLAGLSHHRLVATWLKPEMQTSCDDPRGKT